MDKNNNFKNRIFDVSGHRTLRSVTDEIIQKIGINDDDDSYYKKFGRIIRGEQEPDLRILLDVADTYNCPIDYLLGRSDNIGNLNISKINRLKDYTAPILRRIANDIIFLCATAGFDFNVLPPNILRSMYSKNEDSKLGMVVEAEEAEFLFWYYIKPVMSGYEKILSLDTTREDTKMKLINDLIADRIEGFTSIINDPIKFREYVEGLKLNIDN